MMLLIEHRVGGQFNQHVLRCQSAFDPLLKSQIHLLRTFGRPQASFSKQQLKFYRLKNRKTREMSFPQWIALLEKALNLKKKFKEDGKIFVQGQKILKKAARIPSTFWRTWLELAVALNTQNHVWIRRLAARIIQTGPYQPLFYTMGNFAHEKQLTGLFDLTLEKFKQKRYRRTLNQILADKIDQLQGRESKIIWPLSKLRNMSTKGPLATRYFDFWYAKYTHRTLENELATFLRQVLTPEVLSNASISQFWIFKHYFPSEPRKRTILFKKLIQAWKSDNMYRKFVVIQLVDREVVKKALREALPEFKKAAFKIKRNYYRELLQSQTATDFALYNLIKMGDQNPRNLWWLTL